MKKVFIINGSAGTNTANQHLIRHLAEPGKAHFTFTIFEDLKALPPFDPDLTLGMPPRAIVDFRLAIGAGRYCSDLFSRIYIQHFQRTKECVRMVRIYNSFF